MNDNKIETDDELTKFVEKQQSIIKSGQTMVITFIVINFVFILTRFIMNFNFIPVIIQGILSVLLYRGFKWVKYFYVILFPIGAIVTLIQTFQIFELNLGGVDNKVLIFSIAYTILYAIFEIASSIILFKSKRVSEFLYTQRNG